MQKMRKQVNKILLFILIFNVIGNANALKSNNYHISRDLINRFCDEKRQIIFKNINYCEKLLDIQKVKESDDVFYRYDYFTADGNSRFAMLSEVDIIFSKEDGKIVNSDSYFYGHRQESRYSLFFIEGAIIFFYEAIIRDYSAMTIEDTEDKDFSIYTDLPITNYLNVLIMDKDGNYKVLMLPYDHLTEIKYEDLKKEFDWLIKFLRKELPIKIEY